MKEQRVEDLQLDFKLAPIAFQNRDERKLLAKAISGFANAMGGLIVWGVDAREDADGVDCAQRVVGVPKPKQFLSRLVDHAGAATSPAVEGVRHKLVGSFALTFVPESHSGPHMAKHGEDRYYKRSGDKFLRMEHYEVQDMFGRRPRPRLRVIFTPEEGGSTVVVSIRNDGRGVARGPYLSLTMPGSYRASDYGHDGNGTFGLPRLASGRTPSFGGQADRIIHPTQTLPITRLDASSRSHGGAFLVKGPQRFAYEIAAEGFPLTKGEKTFAFHRA